MIMVDAERDLADFRKQLSGPRLLEMMRQHSATLVSCMVGVGKSFAIDGLVETATRSNEFDLVVVFCPTHQIIEERLWVKSPPAYISVRILKPRPQNQCGDARNRQWSLYEKSDLGLLGRREICKSCPNHSGCFWPGQYGKSLNGVRVIFAAQQHLIHKPAFVKQLKDWTGAMRVLVILDEDHVLLASYRRKIRLQELNVFHRVLKTIKPGQESWAAIHEKWVYITGLMAAAPTKDLRGPGWDVPPICAEWVIRVQEAGRVHGSQFRFLAYLMQQFARSPSASRDRELDETLSFAAPPVLSGDKLALFSGTSIPEFASFRLGVQLHDPFSGYRFAHAQTNWFNIANRIGAKRYFSRNSAQILDFFAALTARRRSEGKRVMLFSKKCYIEKCREEMQRRIREFGIQDAQIVTGNWSDHDLKDPRLIPLVNYGVIGTNLFEQYDCAYCLNSYYVTENEINSSVQDVMGSDAQIALSIKMDGQPLRRKVQVVHPQDKFYDVERLAQYALIQQENDVVLQAVGRVRPFTKPREIITFQAAEHARFTYSQEFGNLEDARNYFKLTTSRTRQAQDNAARIKVAKAEGQTQEEAAATIGICVRTVQRYWNSDQKPATKPIDILI